MRHKERRLERDINDRDSYAMCKRKRKLKSSQASRLASRFGQRKYACPICGQWHLTKQRGSKWR